jgi:hypothetical protein
MLYPVSSPGMRAVALVLVASTVGCAATPAQVAIPNGGHDPAPLARCKIAADQKDPLVTEWPASSKARLEALMRDAGGIAVAYSGCELQIVDECRVAGTYEWRRTTLSTDSTDIRDDDELYAKMPLGAASLEGELRRAGALKVVTEVAGEMDLVGFTGDHVPDTPACAKATHVVRGVSVGAFKLLASGQAGAKAGVNVGPVGGGGGSSESQSVLREAGDPMQCTQTTSDAPDPACRSPIQIFLDRVHRDTPPPPPAPANTETLAVLGPGPESAFSAQPAPPSEPMRPSSAPSRIPGWILAGAGLVSLGIGTYLFTQAASAKSNIQGGGYGTGADIQSVASTAATDTNVGFILVGAGVALALTALPFFLASGGSSTNVASGVR